VDVDTTASCNVPKASKSRTDQSKPDPSLANDTLRRSALMVQPVQVRTLKTFPKNGKNPLSSALP
jgi:hypothetical protein